MGSRPRFVIPLSAARLAHGPLVGGKAARLGALAAAGHPVPPGFCVTVRAYESFLKESRLSVRIGMELGRKRFEDLRWEEIWDAALRIRSAFLAHPVPAAVSAAVAEALAPHPPRTRWAVRSSAPGEDSARGSFAGLHESYVDVAGGDVTDAVRKVWASLWSDAALLYRQELSLDPTRSRMAVLVQVLRDEDVSGVAFGTDPRGLASGTAMVEAVPGRCSGLVDGEVDPDHWELRRADGVLLEWRSGRRDGPASPLLDVGDLTHLLDVLADVEARFSWPPDVEWTGRKDRFALLQARPVTTLAPAGEDPRGWYLTLRPGADRLRVLRDRVAGELIPALEAEGSRLAGEDLEALDDAHLAAAVRERLGAVQRWTHTYREDFIPFAHGVRRLAVCYNDAVRPRDPYEFVRLLEGGDLLAVRRNETLRGLSEQLRGNRPLRAALETACAGTAPNGAGRVFDSFAVVRSVPGGEAFLGSFEEALAGVRDLAWGDTRLADRPDLILRTILEMVAAPAPKYSSGGGRGPAEAAALERRFLETVEPGRREEALNTLETARLSWRLRDNDNLLLARVEAQLIRAVELGARRLASAGRMDSGFRTTTTAAEKIAEALTDGSSVLVDLTEASSAEPGKKTGSSDGAPRQLVGQPAAPGLRTGRARVVRSSEDLGRFRFGEVLVCDAIQPVMTHLVPLSAAVVERRGGMLIHGAIIARELGVPCVNGVPRVTELLTDGDLLTVDGHLGIVTVGPPEFDLELLRTP